MAKNTKPLTQRPDWIPDDGPRYIVYIETKESSPGITVSKGILETDVVEEATAESIAAAKEEGKKTFVWDRWERQLVEQDEINKESEHGRKSKKKL